MPVFMLPATRISGKKKKKIKKLNNFSKQRNQNNTPFYVCTPSIAALTPG